MEPDEITPVRCIFKEITVSFVLGYNDAEFQRLSTRWPAGKIDPRPILTDVIGVERGARDVPGAAQARTAGPR